jgi:hypothetical protein
MGTVTCSIEDFVVIGLVCVLLEVFLTALYFRVTYCPTFRACTPFMQVLYVPEYAWEVLGKIRHLREWGTSSEDVTVSCHVECITQSVLTFSQFGENTGFALGMWCQVCGPKPLLHQSTMGLAQEWTPLR